MTTSGTSDKFKGDVRLLTPIRSVDFSKKMRNLIISNHGVQRVADLMAMHSAGGNWIIVKRSDTRDRSRVMWGMKHKNIDNILLDEMDDFLQEIDPNFKTGTITLDYWPHSDPLTSLKRQFSIDDSQTIPKAPKFETNQYKTSVTEDGVHLSCIFNESLSNLISNGHAHISAEEINQQTGGELVTHNSHSLSIVFKAESSMTAIIDKGIVAIDFTPQKKDLTQYTRKLIAKGRIAAAKQKLG